MEFLNFPTILDQSEHGNEKKAHFLGTQNTITSKLNWKWKFCALYVTPTYRSLIWYIAYISRPFGAGGVGIERCENAGVGKTALKFSIYGIPNWGNIIEVLITLVLIIILWFWQLYYIKDICLH